MSLVESGIMALIFIPALIIGATIVAIPITGIVILIEKLKGGWRSERDKV